MYHNRVLRFGRIVAASLHVQMEYNNNNLQKLFQICKNFLHISEDEKIYEYKLITFDRICNFKELPFEFYYQPLAEYRSQFQRTAMRYNMIIPVIEAFFPNAYMLSDELHMPIENENIMEYYIRLLLMMQRNIYVYHTDICYRIYEIVMRITAFTTILPFSNLEEDLVVNYSHEYRLLCYKQKIALEKCNLFRKLPFFDLTSNHIALISLNDEYFEDFGWTYVDDSVYGYLHGFNDHEYRYKCFLRSNQLVLLDTYFRINNIEQKSNMWKWYYYDTYYQNFLTRQIIWIDEIDNSIVFTDQMYHSYSLDYDNKIIMINDMVENESSRSICKILLEQLSTTQNLCLNLNNTSHKKFYDYCQNYHANIKCYVLPCFKIEKEKMINQIKQIKIDDKNTDLSKYIINNWLIVAKFLDYLKDKDKGKQHRDCKNIVIMLNDKWVETFNHNTNVDCKKLIEKFKRLGIQSRIHTLSLYERKMKYFKHIERKDKTLEDQMFSFLKNFSDSVQNIANISSNVKNIDFQTTCQNFNMTNDIIQQHIPNVVNRIELMSNKFDMVSEKFLQIIEGFNMPSNFLNFFMPILKFVSFGFLISQETNQTRTNIAALISLIMPTGVGNFALQGLTRAVMGIIGYFSAVIVDQGIDDDHSYNFGTAMFTCIKGMMQSTFTTIDSNAYNTMRINTYFLKTISEFLKSSTNIVTFLIKVITFIVEWILNKIMEYYGMLPYFLKSDDFEKIINEYVQIKKQDVLQMCGEDLVAARKVIKLRNEINEIEAQMNKNIVHDKTLIYKVSPYIRVIATDLNKAYDDIPPAYKDNCNAHRIKPFFVLISGPPRIGKSKIFQPLLVNYLAHKLKIIDSYQDPQHYCCFRVAGREFWDGGQGKKVIWYNDIFQGIMNEQQLDLALEEIASVVDDNPYHMNMSDVKDKSRCYLQATLVVANAQADTTNANFLNSRLWSQGEHLARRRDINCRLELNDKWKNADGTMNYISMNEFVKQHPDQCYGCDGIKMFPNDFYKVSFLDTKDGSLMYEMTFRDAITYIGHVAVNYYQRQDLVTTRLRENMEKEWTTDQMFHNICGRYNEEYQIHIPDPWVSQEALNIYNNVPTEEDTGEVHDVENFYDASEIPFHKRLKVYRIYNTRTRRYRYIRIHQFSKLRRPRKIPREVFNYLNNINYKNIATYGIVFYMAYKINSKIYTFVHDFLDDFNIFSMKEQYEIMLTNPLCSSKMIVAALKIAGFTFCEMKMLAWVSKNIAARSIPYILFLLDQIGDKMNYFGNFSERLKFCLNTTEYGYNAFMTFIDDTKNKILYSIFGSRDFILSSYYSCQEYFNRTSFLLNFGNDCMEAFRNTKQGIMQRIQNIPGWMSFTAGAALIGVASYALYNYYHDTLQPQSHEGNIKAKRRRILRKLGRKDNKIKMTEQAYDNTNREIERILKHSFMHIKFESQVSDGVWVECSLSGMALNVTSNIFVMPYHYWYRFEYCNKLYTQHNIPSRLKCSWSMKEVTCAYFDAIDVCTLPYGHSSDLVYMRIKNFNCGRDITHFFVSEEDSPILTDAYLYGYRPRGSEPDFSETQLLRVGTTTTISSEYNTSLKTEPILGTVIPSELIAYDHCYRYVDCLTGPGDCSMVFMHTDSHICAKILGIHTAGSVEHHTGISAPIYREDIKEVIDFFKQSDKVITLEIDNQFIDYSTEISSKAQIYVDQGFNVIANTAVIDINGKRRRIKASLPSKNKIQPSIVHNIMNEDFGPTTVAPSQLSRIKTEDGEIISPFEKAFSKMNNHTKNIPHQLHCDIVQSCTNAIKSWPSKWNKNNARLLTWDEAINGLDNLKGLDLTTSSGFPYVLTNTNKKNWFEKIGDKWVMKEELMNQVLRMEEKLSRGIVPPIYFIDTLKDETRPIEKVKMCKTRLFQVGNMAWTILFRKYFGWFMAHCHNSFEYGEMMSGINPNSYDWDLLAKRLIAMSKMNDNGDYEHYDSTLGHQACTGIADSANDFYDTGCDEHFAMSCVIRTALILGSINTFHIVDDFIIMRRQGNPSGFFLTTIINNYANMYYNRYAFVKLTKYRLCDYTRFILSIFFGDDKNAAVHDQIKDDFNMKTFQKVMAEIGLKYTSASKKEITEVLLPIEQITFLKRKFVFDEKMNIWKSQLDHDVIMEIPRWSEGDPTNCDDQMNRFNACLMELANYSEDEFNMVRNKFQVYVKDLNLIGYNFNVNNLFDYQYCMYLMYPKHYPNAKPFYDLAEFGKRQILVMHNEGIERNLYKIPNYIPDNDSVTLWEEQGYTANSQILQENIDGFKFTKHELRVLKKRITKSIQKMMHRIRPVLTTTASHIARIAADACPCPGSRQVYDVVMDMAATGELWSIVAQDDQEQAMPLIEEEEILKPQGIDDDSPVDVNKEVQKTSTFLDVNEMHRAIPLPNLNIHAHRVFNDVTLNNFLNRPFIINTMNWTSTLALYSMQIQFDPLQLLLAKPAIANKFQNIAWIAPDIEITIRANTTVFHYGGLGFCWIPQWNVGFNNAYIRSARQIMNSRNWVQLVACARQPVRFIIPFTHYKNKLTIGKETRRDGGSYEEFVTLFGGVTWPLSSAQTGVVAPVNVSIFARILEPRASGYTVETYTPQGFGDGNLTVIDDDTGEMQNSTVVHGGHNQSEVPNYDEQPAQSFKETLAEYEIVRGKNMPSNTNPKDKQPSFKKHIAGNSMIERLTPRRKPKRQVYNEQGEQESNSGGMISRTMLSIADFVGKFTPIPFLGEVAAPISTILGASGYFAKWMGFSNTTSLESTMPMQVHQPLLLKIEDTPVSTVLAPVDNLTVKDFAAVNSYPNEMSISNYVSAVPQLIYTGQVLATQVPGDIIFRRAIAPSEFVYADFTTPATGNNTSNADYRFIPTYTWIASQYASAWRMSVEFTVHFFSTQFHSCRIAAVYQPYVLGGSLPVINQNNYTNAKNIVFDIQAGQVYKFIVPMDQRTDWLTSPTDIKQNPSTNTLYENNGYITFIIINELTSVITTPTSIGFQVFIRPLEDFQLIGPIVPQPYYGQMATQGIDDVEDCDYPASSPTCLAKHPSISFGSNDGFRVERLHHSCELTSFRQLCNMLTPIHYMISSVPTTALVCKWSPYMLIGRECYNEGLDTITFHNRQINLLKNIMHLFRYVRGGFRMVIVSEDPTMVGHCYSSFEDITSTNYTRAAHNLFPTYVTSNPQKIVPGRTVNQVNAAYSYSNPAYGAHVQNLTSRSPFDITIPWFCQYKCMLTQPATTGANMAVMINVYPKFYGLVANTYVNGGGTSNAYGILAAGADDFLCGWIMPAPEWTRATPSTTNPDLLPRSIDDDPNIVVDSNGDIRTDDETLKVKQEFQVLFPGERMPADIGAIKEAIKKEKERGNQKPPPVNIDSPNDLSGDSIKGGAGSADSKIQPRRPPGERPFRKGPPANRSRRDVSEEEDDEITESDESDREFKRIMATIY